MKLQIIARNGKWLLQSCEEGLEVQRLAEALEIADRWMVCVGECQLVVQHPDGRVERWEPSGAGPGGSDNNGGG